MSFTANSSVLALGYTTTVAGDAGEGLGITSQVSLSGDKNTPQVSSLQMVPASIGLSLVSPLEGASYVRVSTPVASNTLKSFADRNLGDLTLELTSNFELVDVTTLLLTLPLSNFTYYEGPSSKSVVLEARGDYLLKDGTAEFSPAGIVKKVSYIQDNKNKLILETAVTELAGKYPNYTTTIDQIVWRINSIQLQISSSTQYVAFYMGEDS